MKAAADTDYRPRSNKNNPREHKKMNDDTLESSASRFRVPFGAVAAMLAFGWFGEAHALYLNYYNEAMTFSNVGVESFRGGVSIDDAALGNLPDGVSRIGAEHFTVLDVDLGRYGTLNQGALSTEASSISVARNGDSYEVLDFNLVFVQGDDTFTLSGDPTASWFYAGPMESGGKTNCSAFPGLPGGGPDVCAARGALAWETSAAPDPAPAPTPSLPSVPSDPLEVTMDFTGVFNLSAESDPFLTLYYDTEYTVGIDDPLALLDNVWFSHLDYTVESNHGSLGSDGWSLFGDMFSLNELLGSFLDTGGNCAAISGCLWVGGLDQGVFFLGENGLGALAGSPFSDLVAGLSSFETSTFFGGFEGTLSYYTVNDPVNVPEPAALWLFGAGIVGLLATRRRVRR